MDGTDDAGNPQGMALYGHERRESNGEEEQDRVAEVEVGEEFQQVKLGVLGVPEFIKNESLRMLEALVDSTFQFVNQPTLPSQLRFGQVNKYSSNTNVFEHSGRCFSITEHHIPQEINMSSLDTLGNWESGMSMENGTGLLLLIQRKLRGPESLLSLELIRLIKYEKESYARIGVMPRYGDAESIKWFHVQPYRTFHLINAYEDGDEPFLKEFQQVKLGVLGVPEFIKNGSLRMLEALVDSTFQFVNQPTLPSQKNFAPVDEIGEEKTVTNIEGEIPADFPQGIYIRNGPNPLFGTLQSTVSPLGRSSSIWVEGEGMLHAIYFTKNPSNNTFTICYKNRYVESETFKIEKEKKRPCFLPAAEGDSLAILAAYILNQEIDMSSLDTLGNWDVNGEWNRTFTAHPKVVVRGCRASESIIPGPEFGLDKFKWFSRGLTFQEIEEEYCDDDKDNLEEGFLFSRLYEWRFNIKNGGVRERYLTGREFSIEFPMINENFIGLRNKFAYVQAADSAASSICGNEFSFS
ncbi:hypothetical protein J5N97_004428 [Dioscorea zingiberensis]|uniref:Uncharacterized protein n=1 Tax=Dioscorea zingiberensis TaxID=325984 RepID=A0A9D5HS47_9LILI|nr:hypothetical protein J5N97_004428 [Dioscorea zingiberensis]